MRGLKPSFSTTNDPLEVRIRKSIPEKPAIGLRKLQGRMKNQSEKSIINHSGRRFLKEIRPQDRRKKIFASEDDDFVVYDAELVTSREDHLIMEGQEDEESFSRTEEEEVNEIEYRQKKRRSDSEIDVGNAKRKRTTSSKGTFPDYYSLHFLFSLNS